MPRPVTAGQVPQGDVHRGDEGTAFCTLPTDDADVLVELWDHLEARGAVVRRVDLCRLSADELVAHVVWQARRLRALGEQYRPGPPELSREDRLRVVLRRLLGLLADAAEDQQPNALGRPEGSERWVPLPPRVIRQRATVPAWVDLRRLARTVPAPGWSARAACTGSNVKVFYPDDDDYRAARELCLSGACPVVYDCLAAGLGEDHGCWAATSPLERRETRAALARAGLRRAAA